MVRGCHAPRTLDDQVDSDVGAEVLDRGGNGGDEEGEGGPVAAEPCRALGRSSPGEVLARRARDDEEHSSGWEGGGDGPVQGQENGALTRNCSSRASCTHHSR